MIWPPLTARDERIGFLPLIALAGAAAGPATAVAGSAALAAGVAGSAQALGVFDTLGSAAKSALNGPLFAPFRAVIEGPLRDFARTAGGKAILGVLSTALYGPIAQGLTLAGAGAVAPQAASAIWAAPGALAGEPFFRSWALGFVDRVKQLAQMFGAKGIPPEVGAAASKAFAGGTELATRALSKLSMAIPAAPSAAFVEQLSGSLASMGVSVRPDALAEAVAAKTKNLAWQVLASTFDPVTGKPGPRGVEVAASAAFEPTTAQRLAAAGAKLAASPGLAVLSLDTSIGRKLAFARASEQFAAAGVPKVVERLQARDAPVKGAAAAPAASSSTWIGAGLAALGVVIVGGAYAYSRRR